MRSAYALLLVALLGCRQDRLAQAGQGVWAEPSTVDFGEAFVGYERSAAVVLHSASRHAQLVRLDVSPPFSAPAELELPGGQAAEVPLGFLPLAEGPAEGVLRVAFGDSTLEVALVGVGRTAPSCVPSDECVAAHFDPTSGRCEEVARPDGVGCGLTNRCLLDGRCLSGRCVGNVPDCNDRNVCTVDSCDPAVGCRHEAFACPTGSDPCQVPVCRPVSGCGFSEAPDGTSCGPNDCLTARVCMSGACESRPAPEGSTCAPPTLCSGPATCRQQACVRAASVPLVPVWRLSFAPPMRLRFGGTVDPDGNVYFSETDGAAKQTYLVSLDRDGTTRFRVPVGGGCEYCSAELMLAPREQRVYLTFRTFAQARSSVDGRLLWERDLSVGITAYFTREDGGAVFGAYDPTALRGNLVGAFLGEGYELHNQYLFALDPTNGQVAWWLHRKGHVYGQGTTAAGETFISSADCWAPTGDLARLEPNGTIGASAWMSGLPTAFLGEHVVFSDWNRDLTLLDKSLDASVRLTMPSGVYPNTYSPVGAGARLVVPGYTIDPRGYRSAAVSELDLSSGRASWSLALPGFSESSELMLSAAGDVLVSSGVSFDGGGAFTRVDRDGGVVFQCPLLGSPQSPPVVVRGRATVVVWRGGSYELVSYELPGLDVASSGWVGAQGGPLRDNRAR